MKCSLLVIAIEKQIEALVFAYCWIALLRCCVKHATRLTRYFSARCNIYISALCYDVSVRLSVCPSVCDVCALWSQCAMDPGYFCMLG